MSEADVHDDAMAPPTLADVTKRLRGTSTQAVFAEAIGVSPSLVAHVEAGTRSFSVDNIERIVQTLGLSGDEALSLRRARDRKSGTKEPSIPAQIANVERILGRQLDRMEESLTQLHEMLGADPLGSLRQEVDEMREMLRTTQTQFETLLEQAVAVRENRPEPGEASAGR